MGHGALVCGLAALTVAFAGCGRSEDDEGGEGEPSAEEAGKGGEAGARVSALPEAPTLPDTASYTLQSGGTVSEIASERYGSSHYTRLILLHNRISDPSRLPIGKMIKTPPLIDIYHDAGVMPVVGDEVLLLLKAHAQLRAIEGPVQSAYGDKPAWDPVEVPPEVVAAIGELQTTLNRAADGFAKEKPEVEIPPHKLVEQLREAVKILDKMAAGTSGTPDVDGIHQRIGNAMSYTILWAQHGYK